MIKLAWQILNNGSDLWVQVMQGKYFKHVDGQIVAMKRSNHSSLWKAIVEALPLMKSATCWIIINGRTTCFWNHRWLDHDIFLRDHILQTANLHHEDSYVAEWIDENEEWNWKKLHECLPSNIISLIAGMEPPKSTLGEVKCIWGLERDGRFRLKSAYNLVADQMNTEGVIMWKNLWKWKGPYRTKHFLWLVMHDRLLANKERVKRKMTTNGNCSHCKDVEETTEHTMRNCSKTTAIWEKFRSKVTNKERDLPFKEWLSRNLSDETHGVDFGMIVWHLWNKGMKSAWMGRCMWKNPPSAELRHGSRSIKWHCRMWREALDPLLRIERSRLASAWQPPPEGSVQVHSDGSVLSPSGSAAVGGLIRDSLGRYCATFSCNLG
ncbi:unnamed protein product [Linum trigynum]|uniref:Reverse transcriptase zinc-binding domain-containing protein n=1 Tax=Linum trigynum TaxID=586398 RepID=A0AAV2EDK1_9ROSI